MPKANKRKIVSAPKRQLLAALALLICIILFVVVALLRPDGNTVAIHTPKQTLKAAVANTNQLREQGLSGKNSLGAQEAMLFIFDDESAPGIWMKDMKFAIDIVWLDSAKKVVSLKQNASPDSYPEVFYPSAPARYVIELRANHAQELGIGVGTTLEW